MKNLIQPLSRSLYLLALIALISCSREEQLVEQIGSLQIQVDVNTPDPNARVTDDATPVALLISIDGPKKLVMERIELVNFGGEYLSKPILLPVGNYNLTEFLVINNNNEVIFATPKAGSTFAPLVSIPLPFNFDVAKDYVSQMSPQVLPANLEEPVDFGYSTFTFLTKDYFLLTTLGLTEEGAQFIDPKIYLTHKTDTLFSSAVWQRNMMIPYPASSDSIKLTLLKHGYERYDQVFTTDSLKYYKESPLTIALETAFTIELELNEGLSTDQIFWIEVESQASITIKNGFEVITQNIENDSDINLLNSNIPITGILFISISGDLKKFKRLYTERQNIFDADFSQLTNLQELDIVLHSGKKLDLSSISKLEYLYVAYANGLEIIDISNIENLIDLNLAENSALNEIIFPHKTSLERLYYVDCPNLPLPDFNEYPSLLDIMIFSGKIPMPSDQIDALYFSLYSSLKNNPRFKGWAFIGNGVPSPIGEGYMDLIKNQFLWHF